MEYTLGRSASGGGVFPVLLAGVSFISFWNLHLLLPAFLINAPKMRYISASCHRGILVFGGFLILSWAALRVLSTRWCFTMSACKFVHRPHVRKRHTALQRSYGLEKSDIDLWSRVFTGFNSLVYEKGLDAVIGCTTYCHYHSPISLGILMSHRSFTA